LMFPVAWHQSFLRVLLVSAALLTSGAFAQNNDGQDAKPADKPAVETSPKDTASASPAQPTDEAQDPLKRAPNAKQKKKNERALKIELSKPYKKWLEEDVVYI